MSNTNDKTAFWQRLKSLAELIVRSRSKAEEKRAEAEHLKLIYERFHTILKVNDSALELFADIEDHLLGRERFSLSGIMQRIHRVMLDVSAMIRALNDITEGKYTDLYAALRRIYAEIDLKYDESADTLKGPLVIPLERLRQDDAALGGTKMSNLGEVRNVLGMNVPDGFVITTVAFHQFMSENGLWEWAGRLEEVLDLYGSHVAAEACREVQKSIISAPVPAAVEAEIFNAFDRLSEGQEILVAVRSSAVGEDKAASHAGQYLTELNVGRDWLLDAYKHVIASSYGLEPVSYRLEHGLTVADSKMAVGVIKMLEPRYSGIMFSRDFQDPQADHVVVSATSGLSDTITRGGMSAEEMVLSEHAEESASESSLEPAGRSALRQAARVIETHFGGPQDIEWALEQNDKLYILQCRPMGVMGPISTNGLASPEPDDPLISGGITACPGIGAGPVSILRSDDDLDRFPIGGVLVAKHSSPKFSRVMTQCAAIITEKGSPSGHMAILAREFRVPTIVGMEGAIKVLENYDEVTVNADTTRVFEGILPMAAQGRDPKSLYESPAMQKLRRIASFVTPLHLIDPNARNFAPSHCTSVHDITRFIHEKVFESIFWFGDRARKSQRYALKLEGHLPYDVFLLDVGGGLVEGAGNTDRVPLSDIQSAPLKAFLEGLLDERNKWDKPRSVSARGFMSVLGGGVAGPPPEAQGVGKRSFAIISDRYMNFSTKAGYHFNTVDTYCGKSINKNYIHFRFEGGGANEVRRARRCRFISMVLESLDFRVQCRRDMMVARLEKYDRETILTRLADLGRLTLCTRQLDMLMDSDDSPDFFAKAFLAGELEKF
jgi:pyruvate,water dikinase